MFMVQRKSAIAGVLEFGVKCVVIFYEVIQFFPFMKRFVARVSDK
jgi:hypothetical protein